MRRFLVVPVLLTRYIRSLNMGHLNKKSFTVVNQQQGLVKDFYNEFGIWPMLIKRFQTKAVINKPSRLVSQLWSEEPATHLTTTEGGHCSTLPFHVRWTRFTTYCSRHPSHSSKPWSPKGYTVSVRSSVARSFIQLEQTVWISSYIRAYIRSHR